MPILVHKLCKFVGVVQYYARDIYFTLSYMPYIMVEVSAYYPGEMADQLWVSAEVSGGVLCYGFAIHVWRYIWLTVV